jgi:hypothetical protein
MAKYKTLKVKSYSKRPPVKEMQAKVKSYSKLPPGTKYKQAKVTRLAKKSSKYGVRGGNTGPPKPKK